MQSILTDYNIFWGSKQHCTESQIMKITQMGAQRPVNHLLINTTRFSDIMGPKIIKWFGWSRTSNQGQWQLRPGIARGQQGASGRDNPFIDDLWITKNLENGILQVLEDLNWLSKHKWLILTGVNLKMLAIMDLQDLRYLGIISMSLDNH